MDQSFYDKDSKILGIDRQSWEQEGIELLTRAEGTCDRQILFTRLIRESDAYRRYFSALVTEILNHRLTKEFLLERVGYYRRMLREFGRPHGKYVTMLEEFMDRRADFLRSEMVKHFHLEGPFSCRVRGADGLRLLIDGYTYETAYAGRYFKGQKIVLEPAGSAADTFSHWLVDGRRVNARRLEHLVENDMNIEAIFNSR